MTNLFLVAAASTLLAVTPTELVPYAEVAFRSDPEVRIEDAYKWLFHATHGGEHAIQDEGAAKAWLDREWASLGPPEPGEPLIVPLRLDGRLVRLNLRPFKAKGGDPADLLAAFVRSARSFRPDSEGFEVAWQQLGRRLEEKPMGHLDVISWRTLDAEARAKGFPAWHHSSSYVAARHPAYRVLTSEEALRLTAGR